ncbi:MAG: hypothetical protein GXY48_11465 [Methanomicrobiales archaeon]|nr:hypothetical protein [Methanomicrobiales archaeon]
MTESQLTLSEQWLTPKPIIVGPVALSVNPESEKKLMCQPNSLPFIMVIISKLWF